MCTFDPLSHAKTQLILHTWRPYFLKFDYIITMKCLVLLPLVALLFKFISNFAMCNVCM